MNHQLLRVSLAVVGLAWGGASAWAQAPYGGLPIPWKVPPLPGKMPPLPGKNLPDADLPPGPDALPDIPEILDRPEPPDLPEVRHYADPTTALPRPRAATVAGVAGEEGWRVARLGRNDNARVSLVVQGPPGTTVTGVNLVGSPVAGAATFFTRELAVGQDYPVEVKTMGARDGHPVTLTRTVPVRAGDAYLVVPPATADVGGEWRVVRLGRTAGSWASLVVAAPAGARVTVGDVGGNAAFLTPVLIEGRDYPVEVKARATRGGRIVTLTQTLMVRAGGSYAVVLPQLDAVSPRVTASR